MKNLNEKIKVPELKTRLEQEFSQFGTVIDVVAHKNLRMRGQAFVVFGDVKSAEKAQEEYKNHELFGKPMIVQFAKSRSDAIVKRTENEEEFEKHKQERLKSKVEIKAKSSPEETKKRRLEAEKKKAKKAKISPDTQPPNKVLFLENLPPGISQEKLTEIFSAYPGFIEVRLVPVRRLGFVEYYSDEEAIVAREQTAGLVLEDHTVKITYAKK